MDTTALYPCNNWWRYPFTSCRTDIVFWKAHVWSLRNWARPHQHNTKNILQPPSNIILLTCQHLLKFVANIRYACQPRRNRTSDTSRATWLCVPCGRCYFVEVKKAAMSKQPRAHQVSKVGVRDLVTLVPCWQWCVFQTCEPTWTMRVVPNCQN